MSFRAKQLPLTDAFSPVYRCCVSLQLPKRHMEKSAISFAMNKRISTPLLFISFLLAFQFLSAQSPSQTIAGQVLAEEGRKPLEFATISLIDPDTETKVGGTLTDANGNFSLQTELTTVSLEISFMGLESLRMPNLNLEGNTLELGEIFLKESAVTLDEVVIAGETSSTEFRLDRRIFNVGKDLSSTGASALEVLNNVPSVNVNIEGVISLRGSSGVQVLINGKPSVLTSEEGNALGSITADMIDRVEVITNPSAKYEAEGTSGIINIVLKKEERRGANGSVSLNTGWPHNHSFGLSVNRRSEKFNLFGQVGAGYRSLPNDRRTIQQDLETGSELISTGQEFRNENFYNVILGTDYYFDRYNVITLSGNFAYEIEDQPSETQFAQFDGDGNLLAEWLRDETTSAQNPKYQYELQYKRDFRDNEDHTLLMSALGNFFGKSQSSFFTQTDIEGQSPVGDQQTRTAFQEAEFTFKLDYTKPFTDAITLETGSQYVINDVSNDFAVDNFINAEWVNDPGFTNVFEYDQKVLAGYATMAYEGNRAGLKLGLRAENTDLRTFLVNTEQTNQQNFTNFFPSGHFSWKIGDAFSVQAGYSRRIRRPRLWDLNPFFNIRNNFNIRAGNPNLLPEFTDSYEISSIHTFKNLSFNFSLYYRYTTDVVERLSILDDGITITTPFNIGTNQALGLEGSGKYSPAKWLTFNGDFNYLTFQRKGEFDGANFDFSATQWSSKVTSKIRLKKGLDIEVTGRYRSAVQTVQGINSENLWADLGVRKKFLKGKAVLSFSVRDIFASRIQETNTFQPDFYLYSFRQRGRFMTLGFSYGFGKGEAMEFSGRRR